MTSRHLPLEPISLPITGREATIDPATPAGALAQFYRGFNGRDLALVETNWSAAADIAMDNPLGGIKRGWPEIQAVYSRLFSGPATVQVEFHDYTIHEGGDLFYAVGRERGHFRRGEASLDLAIRTSRIFRRAGPVWRQVHHHGSIEDAALLAAYQAAVSGSR
ncbi:MAG: YybH family protein [Opitutales bacterium]